MTTNDGISRNNFDTSPFVLRQLAQWVGNVSQVIEDETHPVPKLAVIEPSEFRPYTTLYTVGLSNFNCSGGNYELSICLPNWWRIDKEGFDWPVNLLKTFYRDGTGLGRKKGRVSGIIKFEDKAIWSSMTPFLPSEMRSFQANDVEITTLGLIPLYDDEVVLASKIGPDAFTRKMLKSKLTELYNPWRRSLCLPN